MRYKLLKSEIKNFLKQGKTAEWISSNYDIPIKAIKNCIKELNEEALKGKEEKRNAKEISRLSGKIGRNATEKTEIEYTRLGWMKKRYKELSMQDLDGSTAQNEWQTDEQVNAINDVIAFMTLKKAEMTKMSFSKKREAAMEFVEKINGIQKFNLSLEQATKINDLLASDEFKKFKLYNSNSIYGSGNVSYHIHICKIKVSDKILNAIDHEIDNIQDIESLMKLEQKFRQQNITGRNSTIQLMENKFHDKKTKLKQQSKKTENSDISESLVKLIEYIVEGKCDHEVANSIIAQEIKNRIQNGSRNKFALSEEEQKHIILVQVRQELVKNAEKYVLDNPMEAIERLFQLDKANPEFAITTVVKNLLERKDYENARQICDYYTEKSKKQNTQIQLKQSIFRLRKSVDIRELSDTTLFYLNRNNTPEEEEEFFKYLDEKVNREGINMQSVVLGKRQNGMFTITLADICSEKRKKIESIVGRNRR